VSLAAGGMTHFGAGRQHAFFDWAVGWHGAGERWGEA